MPLLSRPRLGWVISIKEMNVKMVWEQYRSNAQLAVFFPDSCQKKTPPRDYFWAVFSVVHKEAYEEMLKTSKTRLNVGRELVAQRVAVPDETRLILQSFDPQTSLNTLCDLTS